MTKENFPNQRLTIHFSGTVQGVGFRYTALRLARDCGVNGFVCNLPDGRVEAIVEGDPGENQRFIALIREEMGNYISSIEQSESDAEGGFTGFQILF